eukprot:g10876.t1
MGVQSGTYGEITPQGVERMLQKLKTGHEFSLTDEDVFLDLGAGVGKVVLHVFLATAVGTVVGVEWGEKRCAKALLARDRLLENVLRHHAPDAAGTEAQAGVQELFKEKITFRCEDVARTDLSAATVVFFCCIVFEEQTVKRVAQKLLEKAKKLRFFITTQKVPDDKYLRAWVSLPRAEKPVLRTYELVDRWRLPMSWTSEEGGNMTLQHRVAPTAAPQIRYYHEAVIDHFNNPRNVGKLDAKKKNVGSALVGKASCGDVIKLQIEVDETSGKIKDAKFKTFGCGSAIASSSLATEMIINKDLSEAGKLKNTDISAELNLPPVKIHCSVLAEEAIQAAIEDYKKKQAEA